MSATVQAHLSKALAPFSTSNSPVQQVLNNQELTRLVVGSIAPATNPNHPRSKNNLHVLASLATVNTAFFHASTDVVWNSMPSISPFLLLLPPCPDESEPKPLGDPWSRFRVYSGKASTITVVDDKHINVKMPTHWFFFLHSHSSRPAVLFPKLARLRIFSFSGLNASLPFQFLPNLRSVYIHDFSEKPGSGKSYDPSKRRLIISLIAGMASNSPLLREAEICSPLTKQMAYQVCQLSSLSAVNLNLPSPVTISDLVFLNTIPQLKALSLASSGTHGKVAFPRYGQHLVRSHPEQGKSTGITTLSLQGDGFFIYMAALFFSSSAMRVFTGKIPNGLGENARTGTLLVPHIVHVIIHHAPGIQKLIVESDSIGFGREEIELLEDADRIAIPVDLFVSFSKLRHLKNFTLRDVPFIAPDFANQLVKTLPNMPYLIAMSLTPMRLTASPAHKLILPSFSDLHTLSHKAPALRVLCMGLDLSHIPSEPPDASLPVHGLRRLFILPGSPKYTKLPLPELINLAIFLDRVFPRLTDMTSSSDPVESGPDETTGALEIFWKDVERLVKSYQMVRKVQAGLPSSRD